MQTFSGSATFDHMIRSLVVFFFVSGIRLCAQIPQEGLEAFYPFNGNAEDESSNDYHAAATGTSFVADRLGHYGHALHLESSDQIAFPLQTLTPFSGDFSIALWFKTPNQVRSHLIELGYWIGGDGDGGNFQISLVSGGTVWAYWNGLGENAMISQQVVHVNDNRWHHMVIARSSGAMSLYIDKMPIQMMPWSAITYTEDIGDDEPLIIGNTENPYRVAAWRWAFLLFPKVG